MNLNVIDAINRLEGEMLPEVLRLVNIELSYVLPNLKAKIVDNCISIFNGKITMEVDSTEEELICWCVMVSNSDNDYCLYKSINHTEAVKRFVEEVFFTNQKDN
jgi:hypothetical protein